MSTVILVPTAITDAAGNIASGVATDIDNGVATPQDGALVTTKLDAFVAGVVDFTLSDLPGDFDTINTAQFRVRSQFVNPGTGDACDYSFTVVGTGVPAENPIWAETDAGAGFANRGAASGQANSATEVQINAWVVRLEQLNYAKDMAADALYLDISEIEIIIDYDPVVAGGATELDFERGSARGIARGVGRGIE